VRCKNTNGNQIERTPTNGLEDLELQAIDVAHFRGGASWVVDPKQIEPQVEQRRKIHIVIRRAQFERLCFSEAELEQVDSHESQKGNAGDGQVQLA